HGDDHFFPGPTDIAWDLAGLIVEWSLDGDGSRVVLDEYSRIARDNAWPRLPNYLVAYCAFRMGFSVSAAQSLTDSAEQQRFGKEARHYREKLGNLLHTSIAA